ncbi:GNAT family N-acetyltransferase [Nocardia sp. NPDC050630]|uniref:GNAT family N-acetyltransferase n=1 Tax=Nocardia sp. NPDC050630 TaxID=3364321 RepID=UPI0037BD7F73
MTRSLVHGSAGWVSTEQPCADTRPWRQAACQLYETPNLVVPLGEILHWRAVVEALGIESTADATLLTGGYFYRPHTSAPSESELDAARHEAAAGGARWLLYPVVRDDDAGQVLARHDFVDLPWFIEAEFVAADDIDHDLRKLLGGTRFRELRRLVRRADEQFEWDVVTGSAIDEDILMAFDRLHRMNLAKYGHTRNHFALPILRNLAKSSLGERMCVFLHRRRDGTPVQAVLALHHPESNTVEALVQGIDHAALPAAQNLYATALYRIYHWGSAHGVNRFNLGRGAQLTKLKLGANRFHVVSNHIGSVAGTPTREFDAVRAAAQASIGTAVAVLRAAIDRHGVRTVLLAQGSVGEARV